MKTRRCQTAEHVAEAARAGIHAGCPGAFRDPQGGLHPCTCECHGAGVDLEDVGKGRLPVQGVDPGDGAESARQDRKKAEKRPTGACECCGAPCRGRFLPGHDAKLKSLLTKLAVAGSVEAWAELVVRDWARLVKNPNVSSRTKAMGEVWAQAGQELVDARVESRASRHQTGMVN